VWSGCTFSPFFTLVLILYLRPDLVLLYLGCASNPLAEKMKNKTKNAVEGIYLSNMLLCFIIQFVNVLEMVLGKFASK
jgi:hypothetical protein